MKNPFISIVIVLCVICPSVAFTGCTWIYDYPCCCECGEGDKPFEVFSDWHDCPNADPGGMAYIFFPVSGGEPWRFDFPGKEGGPVLLPDGEFHVMAFNDDTSNVLFGNEEDYSGFYCYCKETGLYNGLASTPSGTPVGATITGDGEKVVSPPDEMWGESVEWFSLGNDGVAYRRHGVDKETTYGKRIFFIYPHMLTPRYRYVATGIKNLSGVARMCASLSGMAPGLVLSSGKPTGEPATLPVSAIKTNDDEVAGTMFTFGSLANGNVLNKLTLYFWMTDGKKYKYEFDVSRQIADAPDKMNVLITVGNIDLPESGSPSGDGAFDVTVDGWQTYIIDINS